MFMVLFIFKDRSTSSCKQEKKKMISFLLRRRRHQDTRVIMHVHLYIFQGMLPGDEVELFWL